MIKDDITKEMAKIREKVCDELKQITENEYSAAQDEKITAIIDKKINENLNGRLLTIREREKLRNNIFHSIRGLDVLEIFLSDEEVTEIMVNGPGNIFIEKHGRLQKTDEKFEDIERLDNTAARIASKSNRSVNIKSPILDTRLADGSRVNIVLPPAAPDGPVLTIRKFYNKPFKIQDLIRMGSVSEEAAQFLKRLVQAGYNIFVSGGTGSGKTTFLNILSDFIPEDERIITIEDSAELKLTNVKNLVRLEARAESADNTNEISIRDLIKTSLRMRPDRIIVGEVRGQEAIDMLQAYNTGHDGSLSTGHANSAADMLTRLETMVLMGMEIPIAAIRSQISAALDIIVHLGRLRDKSRRVLEISEVEGIKNGEIVLRKLYEFREEGEKDGSVTGGLCRTQNSLKNTDKLAASGLLYE